MRPDFDTMNETDVREIIVRPLLSRLGYAHNTKANIRTEVPLRYDRTFLGRKNPKKDPPLAGRADYICDAISYGRWVVEVKTPSSPLTQDHVEQAHTYAAHPEISASYFMLTNGRESRLYAASRLGEPILAWRFEQTEQHLMTLFNIVGYEAIRKLTMTLKPDTSKPLGAGLPSRVRIVGGQIEYREHHSTHPLLQNDVMIGMIGAITGGRVERAPDGRLLSIVRVLSPYQQLSELSKLAGIGDFEFFSAEEFISSDVQNPTIFQNVLKGQVPAGARAKLAPGIPEIVLPVGFNFTAFSEATGYVDEDTFKGVVSFDYDYQIFRGPSTGNRQLDAMFNSVPMTARIQGSGDFTVVVSAGRAD
jgi:hypothetical protein